MVIMHFYYLHLSRLTVKGTTIMPRANRYYAPGYIWHITHRCIEKKYLLNVKKERNRWMHWLREAVERYELCVLNYCVTCNHIHLLVRDNGAGEIVSSMRLIQGRTGQEYNIRKQRIGAFWNDRYHATAVESGLHLLRCCSYIDLNMVRAGVVEHPSEWHWCGYNELTGAKQRFGIIQTTEVQKLMGIDRKEMFIEMYKERINGLLKQEHIKREEEWTEAIAVGSHEYIQEIHKTIKYIRQSWYRKARKITESLSILKDAESTYGLEFGVGPS